ncbi:MAG: hypothetical protein R3C12_19375 [Planctomycetaceae bacterium]
MTDFDLRGGGSALDTLAVQTADTITCQTDAGRHHNLDLTATTTRFEGDLTGLGGLTVSGTTRFATATRHRPPPSLPEPWCWKRIWN